MKNKLSTFILVLTIFAGVSLLLYPTVSDYWNSLHASQAVADYAEEVKTLNAGQYEEMLEAAKSYNETLLQQSSEYELTEEQRQIYESLLDVDGSGIMGYIEIPTISVSLPIYHGTSESVLQVGVGHLDWSSLPVGGENTHCVLSGHRGLPSAKLFTHLDRLTQGDTFVIRTLNEVLTYEVDQILIVDPADLSSLIIEDRSDLCTLVTCTPYGLNTDRLLVRGHRAENQSEAIRVTSDAIRIEPVIVAPMIAFPVLLVLFVFLMLPERKKVNGRVKNAKRKQKNGSLLAVPDIHEQIPVHGSAGGWYD